MSKKKIMGSIAASFLSVMGCQGKVAEPLQPQVAVKSAKVLVAYYSWGGNTKFVAEQIQKATGGTLFEIKPVKAYSSDYKECAVEAKKDIKAGLKPELTAKVENIEQYEVVFIGSPNWWSTIAPPVSSFVSSYDFSDKTVIPFFTHGGGGLAGCETDIRKLCPKATVRASGVFSGNGIHGARSEISKWLQQTVNVSK